jgi:hypothetical protein
VRFVEIAARRPNHEVSECIANIRRNIDKAFRGPCTSAFLVVRRLR